MTLDLRAVLVVVALLVAGCGVGPTRAPSDATPASTPPDATPSNTVALADLSETERAAFRVSQNETVAFGPPCADTYTDDVAEIFREHAYVRADDRYYEVTVASTGGWEYPLEVFEPFTVSSADASRVVPFESLSGRNRTAVDELLSGEYRSSYCSSPPAIFDGDVAISYQNETYRPQATVIADYPGSKLTTTPYER